jgi:hypothetical protein
VEGHPHLAESNDDSFVTTAGVRSVPTEHGEIVNVRPSQRETSLQEGCDAFVLDDERVGTSI